MTNEEFAKKYAGKKFMHYGEEVIVVGFDPRERDLCDSPGIVVSSESPDFSGWNHHRKFDSTCQLLPGMKFSYAHQSSLELVDDMKCYETTQQKLKELHDVACDVWRKKILGFATEYAVPFTDSVKIPEDIFNRMKAACTDLQLPVFNDVFGVKEPEKPKYESLPDFLIKEGITEEFLAEFGRQVSNGNYYSIQILMCGRLPSTIMGAFCWVDSIKGIDYWNELHVKYEEGCRKE